MAIERTEYSEYVERKNKRVNQNPDYYRQRQQIIEHQFGTLKRHLHFDYTLMTRKEHVMSEVYIQFTLYNLRRSFTIFGYSELINKLKVLNGTVYSFFNSGAAVVDLIEKYIKYYMLAFKKCISPYQLNLN